MGAPTNPTKTFQKPNPTYYCLPKEAHPPEVNHGERSYSVALVLGRSRSMCKIEVHVRSGRFRIVVPKFKRGEHPFFSWGDDPDAAWQAAKSKAAAKADGDSRMA